MITVSVDEAYAFDMLSILEVKDNLAHSSDTNKNYRKMRDEIILQIGLEKFGQVKCSLDYSTLVLQNTLIYQMVNEVKLLVDQDSLACKIDAANYQRFLIKKEIQKKWFEKELKETKHGY